MSRLFRKFRKIAAAGAAVAIVFSLVGCTPEKRSGAENYDKTYYITKYGGDLDSNLSVFPDTVEADRVILYESSFGEGLFDTDGYMILEYRCDEEQIAAEEERLKGISFTITHYDGQTYTNHVRYDEKSYPYPAYIADVYAAYVIPNGFKYKDYLKTDRSAYKKDSLKAFTVYNHSFDGGKSWDEFDD